MEEQIPLYALGTLEGAEREGLRRHLAAGCPVCAGRLAEAEAVFGVMALGAMTEGTVVPTGAKARLDGLIGGLEAGGGASSNGGESSQNGAEGQDGVGSQEDELSRAERSGLRLTEGDTPMRTTSARRSFPWAAMLAAACVAAGVTVGLMYMPLREAEKRYAAVQGEMCELREHKQTSEQKNEALVQEREELKRRLGQVELALSAERRRVTELTTEIVSLETRTRKLSEELVVVENMLKSTQLVTVDLKGTPEEAGGAPEGKAKLVVDLEQKVWKLYAANLKPLEGDGVYEFWLITTDGTKVAMGNFKVNEQGVGTLSDKVPTPLPALAAAAISREPTVLPRDAKEPRGPIQALGAFQ